MNEWEAVEGALERAHEQAEKALDLMEDIGVPHLSENLRPLVEGIGRFYDIATDKAREQV